MANLLRRAEAWLAQQRTLHASEEVHFVRGASTVTVLAEQGLSDHPSEDDDGYETVMQTVDWLIPAADLTVNGEQVEPKQGDRIVAGGLASGEVYEVRKVPGGSCWRWSDPLSMTRRRVHTIRVGTMPIG